MLHKRIVGLIMAGGRGRRLSPLTDSVPKPLLEVGGQPLLARLIEQIVDAGASEIFVSVGYLADEIVGYMKDSKHSAMTSIIHEKSPLDTAGALKLLPADLHSSVLVVNGDIASENGFARLVHTHVQSGAHLTVGASEVDVSSPFGVLTTRGDDLILISEKPARRELVSAGCNVLNSELIEVLMTSHEPCPMPDFIQRAIDGGFRVSVCVIPGHWNDIGTATDLRDARTFFRSDLHVQVDK